MTGEPPLVPEALRKYARVCTFPFQHGVYLAVNAIPDLYLLIDAPICAFTKAEEIYGTHDLGSTLLDVGSRHRIINTRTHVDNIVDGNEAAFIAFYEQLVAAPFVGAIAHTCFPMSTIIGTPYDQWIDRVPGAEEKLKIEVPGRSLVADWIAGYHELALRLARAIPLGEVEPAPDKVAIVGYFFDRNEEDHRGNLRELRRLLGALGLDLVTTWLGGEGIEGLGRVAEASTLIVLPGGEACGRALARRTGASVVETELPFGMAATDRWLRAVGEATGRAERVEGVVEANARELVPRLEWLALRRFVATRWAFAGHPELISGLHETAELLGASLEWAVAWTLDAPAARPEGCEVLHALDMPSFEERVRAGAEDLSLLIANSRALETARPGSPSLNFGFPSWQHHALHDEPFLGYRGLVCFVGRVADQLPDSGYFMR